MTNTALLCEVIKESGLKKAFIADEMNITIQAFGRKLKGESEFKQSEILSLTKLLKLTNSKRNAIFFTDKDDKISS